MRRSRTQQLAEARAEIASLQRRRAVSLEIIAEQYPTLGPEWRSCLAFVLGALGAEDLHERLIRENPQGATQADAAPFVTTDKLSSAAASVAVLEARAILAKHGGTQEQDEALLALEQRYSDVCAAWLKGVGK